jgi:hypothetical protein
LYYNFAAASDTFFCAPLDERAPSPWPDPVAGGWPLPALLALGDLAAGVLALDRQAASGTLEPSRVQELGRAVQQLAAGMGGAQGSPAQAAALTGFAETGRRLAAAGAGEAAPLLSELLIALDSVAGTGTRPPPQPGLASFPAYARATVRRLESIEEYNAQLQASMAPDDWAAWADTLRQLRAELTLMADDVERGRLSLQQLEQQLQHARQIVPPVYPEGWRFVDRESGTAEPERLARIGPEQTEQIRRLTRELYWFHLARVVRLALPPAAAAGG